jgi:hypothetical protein
VTRSIDVFRSLSDEEAQALFGEMRDEIRPLYKQAEMVAANTLRLRPVFLGKQPFPKRCGMMRKALSLKHNEEAAAELLAMFFMERYAEDVAALLDLLGVKHDEGVLQENAPKEPTKKKLTDAVAKFTAEGNAAMRGILVRAFAAQSAIDWPKLDSMVFDLEGAK